MLIIGVVFPFWAVWHEGKQKREAQEYAEHEAKAKRDRIDRLVQEASRRLSYISNSPSIDAFYSDFDAFHSAISSLQSMGVTLSSSLQNQFRSFSNNAAYVDELVCKCIDRNYKLAVDICRDYTPAARDEHMAAFFDHIKSFSNRYSSNVAEHIKSLEDDASVPSEIVDTIDLGSKKLTITTSFGGLQKPVRFVPAKSDEEFCRVFFEKIESYLSGNHYSYAFHPVPRNMIPYLRSPRNSGVREMAFYNGFPDLRIFDNNEYRHIVLLALLASGGLAGPFVHLFRNNEDLIGCESRLWKMGFLVESDMRTTLYNSTCEDLSALLASKDIPSTGKRKADLVTSILENVPASSIQEFCAARKGHEPSDLGYWMIRSLYNDESVSIPEDVLMSDPPEKHITNGRVYVPMNIRSKK